MKMFSGSKKQILFDARFLTGQMNGLSKDSEAILSAVALHTERIAFLTDNRNRDHVATRFPNAEMVNIGNYTIAILKSYIRRFRVPDKFDMVFLMQVHPLRIGFNNRTKLIVRIHDFFPTTNPEWFKIRNISLFRLGINRLENNAILLFNSNATYEISKKILKSPNKSYILPCPNFIRNLNRCQICQACIYLDKDVVEKNFALAIGTIEPRKNYLSLLQWWIDNGLPKNALLLIANEGWKSNKTLNFIQKNHFQRMTNICDASLFELLAKAKIFITSSIDEGFNIPLSYAKSIKIPIIATRIPAHEELLSKSENEFLMVNTNLMDLSADQLEKYLNNELPSSRLNLNISELVTSESQAWTSDFKEIFIELANS